MKYRANRLVLTRLDGGLGNQMFQYAAARAEAVRSGRALVLDPHPIAARRPDRAYGLATFAVAGRLVTPLERFLARAATGARVPGAVRAMVQRVGGQPWRLVREAEADPDKPLLSQPEGHAENLVMEGHWQGLGWFADQASAIRNDFRFRGAAAAGIAPWLARIAACESVAVHVRRGDYASDPRAAAVHGTLPEAYYAEAGERLVSMGVAPRFFIFSDDPDWAAAHLRLPGETAVVRCPAEVPDSESLRLMTLCRHAIIANSTFSWWAAWLAERPGQVVVAPARWFRDRPAPAALFPSTWLLV